MFKIILIQDLWFNEFTGSLGLENYQGDLEETMWMHFQEPNREGGYK